MLKIINFFKFVDEKKKRLTIEIPKIDQHFTGTGDLFSAIFLAWMHKSGNDITISINNSIATLQAVLKKSLELGKGKNIHLYI